MMPPTSDSVDDDDADEQRIARAVDQAREHVAADRVGAEQEVGAAALLPERRHQQRVAVLLVGRMRRDSGAKIATSTRSDEDARGRPPRRGSREK